MQRSNGYLRYRHRDEYAAKQRLQRPFPSPYTRCHCEFGQRQDFHPNTAPPRHLSGAMPKEVKQGIPRAVLYVEFTRPNEGPLFLAIRMAMSILFRQQSRVYTRVLSRKLKGVGSVPSKDLNKLYLGLCCCHAQQTDCCCIYEEASKSFHTK
jgi:hypothetical protein